jgi:hypothetical protein
MGTSVVYDDNVYHRPAAEGDLSIRFSPRLEVRRQTERLTLSGRGELDADRFSQHPELSTDRGREAAGIDLRYAGSPRLTFTEAAAFTATETPDDLNELTALMPGRVRAQRLLLQSAAAYALAPRTTVTMAYLATADHLAGGVAVSMQTASASLERHVSMRDAITLDYAEQHFGFDGDEGGVSRAATIQWTREAGRDTTLTLRAGPRVTDGSVAPEISLSARRALRAGSVSLSYQQTQTTLIGLAGIARTTSARAGFEREIRPRVTLRTTAAVVRARQAGLPSLAYRVSAAYDWRFTPRLAFEAAYDADLQRGDLYALQASQNIRRNLFSLMVVVADRRASTESR